MLLPHTQADQIKYMGKLFKMSAGNFISIKKDEIFWGISCLYFFYTSTFQNKFTVVEINHLLIYRLKNSKRKSTTYRVFDIEMFLFNCL